MLGCAPFVKNAKDGALTASCGLEKLAIRPKKAVHPAPREKCFSLDFALYRTQQDKMRKRKAEHPATV